MTVGSRGPKPTPVAVRLAAKVLPDTVTNVAGLGPCWPFMGARTPEGYGVIRDDGGRLVYAHRVALALALGRPIRPGMFANHHCDYKPCCRPRHLYEGTRSDNEYDKRRGTRPPIGDAITMSPLFNEDMPP